MKNVLLFIVSFSLLIIACNHTKPKPVSDDIHKQAVSVNGTKDSVINNSKQNYGNEATVSSPCVKCLLGIIQKNDAFRKLTVGIPPANVIYNINWITSKNPVEIDSTIKINNGMSVKVQQKNAGALQMLVTYLYNNQNSRFYLLNRQNKYDHDVAIDSLSLKLVRNSCFWGVA